MSKIVSVLIAAFVAVWAFAGSATSASAHYRHSGYHHGGYHHGGGCCGPISPTYVYKTVHPQTYSTKHRHVSVYTHKTRIHRIIYVTRIQPIHNVHIVTHVHHHTIVHTRNVYEHVVEHLPPITHTYGSVVNTYDCTCAGSHHHHHY